MSVWLHNCGSKVEPCAEDILPAAARRLIMTGGSGAPIHFHRPRRRESNYGGGGVRRRETSNLLS